jgi:uncharacterized protein YggU (UPF0235/DUF167 family)
MYIKVRAIAHAKREIVTEESSDHFKISVKEPAERNLANKRILEIIKAEFPGKEVKIISGHHSPSKLLAVDE